MVKIITIGEDILGANDARARANKDRLDARGIFTVNIMSSPGAGKTSLIMGTINALRDKVGIAVIEGDVASSVDADKIAAIGIPVVQINTAGGCHLDANMVEKALDALPLDGVDLLFIENVGNLICPNAFALGEDRRVMISSLPEGHDKPYKYPAMFADTDVVLLNKTDLQPYVDFDPAAFRKVVTGLNPDVVIFPLSCKTGEGLPDWFAWLESAVKHKKKGSHGKNPRP
jgi:hydrogenase nickel incorporation protein HypB